MFLYDFLDIFLLQILKLVLLQVKTHLHNTPEGRVNGVGRDHESTIGHRLPDVLLVIVVPGDFQRKGRQTLYGSVLVVARTVLTNEMYLYG